MALNLDEDFWNGKRVLLTGGCGFKGTWLSAVLHKLNCKVQDISRLDWSSSKELISVNKRLNKELHDADITELSVLKNVFSNFKPQIVFHLAAQPIVENAAKDPFQTFHTNVMGTVGVLQCALDAPLSPQLIFNITTDKVYENQEWDYTYREVDPLLGSEAYSASKVAAENVTIGYNTIFKKLRPNCKILNLRAGNIIGGGDFNYGRLLPDIAHSLKNNNILNIRSLASTRPWQHVLEPVLGYLRLAELYYDNPSREFEAYNFGPDISHNVSVKTILQMVHAVGYDIRFEEKKNESFKESTLLALNSEKLRRVIEYDNTLSLAQTIKITIDWYMKYYNGHDPLQLIFDDMENFCK